MKKKCQICKLISVKLFPVLFLAASLCGCALPTAGDLQNSKTASGRDGNLAESDAGASAGFSVNTSAVSSLSDLNMDFTFSDKQLSTDYTEDEATVITLRQNSADIDGGGASVVSAGDNTGAGGTKITITQAGTYILRGTLDDGSVQIDAGDDDNINLVLDNASLTCEDFAPVFVSNAKNVYLFLPEGSKNSLTDGSDYTLTDDTLNVDGVIFSRADLIIKGSGRLQVTANYKDAVVSKDDLIITGGSFEITAAQGKGLSGKDCVKIADGSFALDCGDDAIHSSNDEDETRGFVYICGGSFTLKSGDDAIHAETALVIEDGQLTIPECNEGLEGQVIFVTGGDIDILSNDDGINAASGTSAAQGGGMDRDAGCQLIISGGTLHIQTEGDGIDSNGYLEISGGEICIDGPTNSGNGPIDYGTEAVITGGMIVAAGSAGMAETFGANSTQCSILQVFDQTLTVSDEITLNDASGKTLLSYAPKGNYQCVIISCPALAVGETYTLTAGTQSAEITLSSVVTSNGSYGGMGDMGGGRGGMGGGMGGGRGGMGGDHGMNNGMPASPDQGMDSAPDRGTANGDGFSEDDATSL